jgi:hypothetical protein
MQSRPLCIIIAASLLFSGFASSQEIGQPSNKKPRTLNDYQPRKLKQIYALEPDPDDLRDKQVRLLTTRDVLPSMVRVTYGGSIRLIPESKKEVIRQWARLYAGSMEHYTEPYQTEMLFTENGVQYWLATPKGFSLLKNEPKKGTRVSLYLIRLGAAIDGDKYDWTLLVEQVRSR